MIIKFSGKDPDIILITGDYYIDSPNNGIAIIARVLENAGYKIWIVSTPDPGDNFSIFSSLPIPRLFFGITSGNIDSTLNLYTVNKVKRTQNVFLPDNMRNTCIKNACIEYSNRIRSIFRNSFIVLGELEATNRKLAHYDFFSDKIMPSLLETCGADIISYGMSENTVLRIADLIHNNKYDQLFQIKGIAHRKTGIIEKVSKDNIKELPGLEDIRENKNSFLKVTQEIYRYSQTHSPYYIVQKQLKHTVIVNPPAERLTTIEMDKVYSLPFTYRPVPETEHFIKAFETVRNTVVTHRGCAGGCSFCSITINQGKKISARSPENIRQEIIRRKLNTVSDLQAPTANMYGFECKSDSYCQRFSCIYPNICPSLDMGENTYISLLSYLLETGKNIFIASGLRYDVLSKKLLVFLIKNGFISGQMKIAPENTDNEILKKMFKPPLNTLERFVSDFNRVRKELDRDIYLIPYIISSFPGADRKKTLQMKEDLIRLFGMVPFQIQDFTPTPASLATALFVCEKNVVRTKDERSILRDILQRGKKESAGKKNQNCKKSKKNRRYT